MKLLILSIYFGFSLLWPAGLSAAPRDMFVMIPVADVWSKTVSDPDFLKDEDRETQVLKGEHVIVHETRGEWLRIEAVEQPEFTHHNRWEGYPGWIHQSALDSRTPSSEPKRIDQTVVQIATQYMGTPYQWGGLSPQGLDCSGLIHLAFRLHGERIPRDAQDQWIQSAKIRRRDLRPGDLIFSAKAGEPNKMTHVTLYSGDGMLIEAPQAGLKVRRISFRDKFGKDLKDVETGNKIGDRVVYFGRLLPL